MTGGPTPDGHGRDSGRSTGPQARLPSVDRVLREPGLASTLFRYGHDFVVDCIREELEIARQSMRESASVPSSAEFACKTVSRVAQIVRSRLRPVFNLTGTVLHTNLGRALLPDSAVDAMRVAATRACTLEFDLADGGRGDRDSIVETLLTRITGAEAATVVNNNAAAVLIALAALARGREALVSRGELVEIGGAFRIPDVMRHAGVRLVEVGTTNRTHPRDFSEAIGPKSALLLKVHTSNYLIVGFTASVSRETLTSIAHSHDLPVLEDLGSGTLVDLSRFGVPREPTPQDALRAGVDIVTFSGDKLLGGPQAGIIVGRRKFIQQIKRNPLKRALRADKITLAALEAVLRLYLDPDRLPERLPTVRLLARSQADIRSQAERLQVPLARALGDRVTIASEACESQVGSGALPTETIPSWGLAIRARNDRGAKRLLNKIESDLRLLPVPVVGRLHGACLLLDLRCLEIGHEAEFVAQLARLGTAD